MRKEVRQLVELAEDYGFQYDSLRGSGHVQIRHRSGRCVTMPATPSRGNSSWRRNTLAQIKRIDREERAGNAHRSGLHM